MATEGKPFTDEEIEKMKKQQEQRDVKREIVDAPFPPSPEMEELYTFIVQMDRIRNKVKKELEAKKKAEAEAKKEEEAKKKRRFR